MDADEILVLDNGTLVERGTHSELLIKPQSLYSKLWNAQHIGVTKHNQKTAREKQVDGNI